MKATHHVELFLAQSTTLSPGRIPLSLVEEVEFGYFAGYVLVGQGGTAEVGKGGEVPVVTDCVHGNIG